MVVIVANFCMKLIRILDWIYWVGPFLGSIVTAGYYRFVKALNYEDANAGQDSADGEFQV